MELVVNSHPLPTLPLFNYLSDESKKLRDEYNSMLKDIASMREKAKSLSAKMTASGDPLPLAELRVSSKKLREAQYEASRLEFMARKFLSEEVAPSAKIDKARHYKELNSEFLQDVKKRTKELVRLGQSNMLLAQQTVKNLPEMQQRNLEMLSLSRQPVMDVADNDMKLKSLRVQLSELGSKL